MLFVKNIFVFTGAFLFLIIGFIFGYMLGANKPPSAKNICIDSNAANDNIKIAKAPGINSAGKTEITAREGLALAIGEAKVWAEDAYLAEIKLLAKKMDANGLANGWVITFYAKSKNKFYEITLKDGESRGGTERALLDKKIPQTLKGDMVDSAVLAKAFFSSYPATAEITSLRMYYEAGSKKFLWTVFFPKGSYTIDAEK